MTQSLSISTDCPTAPSTLQVVAAEEAHVIRTPRLILRPVNYNDLDDYVELLSDPEVVKFVGLDTGKVPSRDEIVQLRDGAVKGWAERGWGRWSIFTRQGEFVGFCGFRREEGLPDLIALTHQRFWKLGLATEAAGACVEYGRTVFGFREINAYTHPENVRARRLLDRIGAVYQGNIEFHGVTGAKYTFPYAMQAAA